MPLDPPLTPPASPELLVEAEGLERSYGGNPAVRKVGLAVARGQILALLGPNGAGKTTILSMLTGNLAPHAGRIRIGGHDLFDEPRAAKRQLGYLPESAPIYPEMTVAEYLRFCARLHGVGRARLGAAVDEACERTGIADERRRILGHLSKGYRQRAGIAQAIVHRPAVIVLDEPSAGLDPLQLREMQGLIRSLASGAAVLVSTHLLGEASEMATHVAILNHGELVHQAPLGGDDESGLRLRVEFARPPPGEELAAVDGVAEVYKVGSGAFLLAAAHARDPRDSLLHTALERDWGLLALEPRRTSLEELFISIAAGTRSVAE